MGLWCGRLGCLNDEKWGGGVFCFFAGCFVRADLMNFLGGARDFDDSVFRENVLTEKYF